MLNAFHTGVVQTDDILNRIDERARAKRKAEQQFYEEQISPEAKAARAAIQMAEKLKAEEAARDAATDAELGPAKDVIRRNELGWKIAHSQTGGTIEGMKTMFDAAGVPMPFKEVNGVMTPDVEQAQRIVPEVTEFLNFRKNLSDRFGAIQQEKFTDASGGEVINWRDNEALSTPEEAGQLRSRIKPMLHLTYEQWKAMNRPGDAGQLFGGAPGQVTQPAAPVVQPAGQVTPGAPAAAPTAPAANVGGRAPGGGIYLKTPAEGGATPTEVQTRAQGALARFQSSGQMIDSLRAEGFDETSPWTWMGAMLPELIRPDNVKAYNAAKEIWTAGVLRYESGAALTKHEEEWYKSTFFPNVNDPPFVVRAKDQARSDLEVVISEVANKGGAGSPSTRALAEDVMRRAEALAGWSGEAGTVSPQERGWNQMYTPEGNTIWHDPETGQFYQPTSATPPAGATTEPAPSIVEPTGSFYMGPNPEAGTKSPGGPPVTPSTPRAATSSFEIGPAPAPTSLVEARALEAAR
jgi:hypothetical protein